MNPLKMNHIKVEKTNTIKLRYQELKRVSNFYYRVFEIFLVFAVLSRVSLQVPRAIFNLLQECFTNISVILMTPQFVFVVGNVIVIILFIINHGDFYNRYSMNIKSTEIMSSNDDTVIKKQKQRQRLGDEITEENNTIMAKIFSTPEHQVIKIYHRNKSGTSSRTTTEKVVTKCCNNLRRSNTDIKMVKKSCCSRCYPEDHMTKDDFRKTVEDFIAKQQRLLKEEEEDFVRV